MGVARPEAVLEVRLHDDLIASRNVEITTAAFERGLEHYRHRIEHLIVVAQSTHG